MYRMLICQIDGHGKQLGDLVGEKSTNVTAGR